MGYFRDWSNAIQARIGPRDALDIDTLHQPFWPEVNADQFNQLCRLIEEEYRIPAGIIRPEDQVDLLLAPIPTKNPLRWMVYQARTEDCASELQRQLVKRIKQRRGDRQVRITTFDQLVVAWCGRDGSTSEND